MARGKKSRCSTPQKGNVKAAKPPQTKKDDSLPECCGKQSLEDTSTTATSLEDTSLTATSPEATKRKTDDNPPQTAKTAEKEREEKGTNVSTARWVVKRIQTELTDAEILKQLQKENSRIRIVKAERILTYSKIPTTLAAVTTEGKDIPEQVWMDKRGQQPEPFIPRIIQCSKCQRANHSRTTCRSKVEICRYCAELHTFQECPLAKQDSDFRSPNENRKCVNCRGRHGARYMGCPYLQKHRDALKVAITTKTPYKEAIRRYETGPAISDTEKTKLQEQINALKKQIKEMLTATTTRDNEKALAEMKEIQTSIQNDLKEMDLIKRENLEILQCIKAERDLLRGEREAHRDKPEETVIQNAETKMENNNRLPPVTDEDTIVETGKVLTGKPRKQRQKVRSRSLIEVASLAGLKLPAITRPKFVDRLISGASSLTSITSFRPKGYKRQLSLELPKSSHRHDSQSIDSSLKDDTIFENIQEPTHHDDCVQFCSRCSLQILVQDVKHPPHESPGSVATCSACKEQVDGLFCAATADRRAFRLVGTKPVDCESNTVDFNRECKDSETGCVSCSSNLSSCKPEFPNFRPEYNNSKPESTECQSQVFDSESEHLHLKLEPADCRSESVDCVSDLVDCRSDPVDCLSDLVDCRADPVDCLSDLVNCKSDPGDCVSDFVDLESKSVDCRLESVDLESKSVDCRLESVDCSECVDCETYSLLCDQESLDSSSTSVNCKPEIVTCSFDIAHHRSSNVDSRSESLNERSHPEESPGHPDCLSENKDAASEFVICEFKSELGSLVVVRSSSLESRPQNECQSEPVDDWSEKANDRLRNDISKLVDADDGSVRTEDNVNNLIHTLSTSTSIFHRQDKNQEEHDPDGCCASQYSLYNTEELEDIDAISESLKSTPYADYRQDTQNTATVFSPGYVRRQCEAFSRSSQLLHASSAGADQKGQQSIKGQILLLTSSVKSVQTRLQVCPVDSTKQWQTSYYSLAWDSKFHRKVMAKGYVKAIAEQINYQGSLINVNGPEDGQMSTSLVHTLTQAAESQHCTENGPISIAKKQIFSSTRSVSNNGSHSERVVSADAQHVPKEMTTKDSEPQPVSATGKPASHQGKETVSVFQSPHSSSQSACPKVQCHKLVTKPLPKFPPNDTVYIPRSPTRPQQSFNRQKPEVDYTSKPKFNQMSSTATDQNNCENSSSSSLAPHSSPSRTAAVLPSSSSSVLSNPSVPCASDKPNSASENDTGNISHPSYNTQSSTHSHDKNDQVFLENKAKNNSDQYSDYDNAPPLNAAELFDSSWSDSDSLDELSDEDGDNGDRKVRPLNLSVDEHSKTKTPDQLKEQDEDKRFRIAKELLQTERDYVGRLHLLHQVFFFRLDNENRQQAFLPADTLQHMFSNTKSIFHFHHDFLLPQLEERMKNWKRDPRVGDLMKKNAPFLKMYTEYIRSFDRAMKLINHWLEKSARFSEIIQDVQKLPECGNLSLQHHMLGPIQRVPRYELLLKDYVKHLPEDSPDMSDAKEALDLVTKAACHSNEAMKKIETFHKLLDIYQSLRGVPVDFISPTREFVTQGPVVKIAARSGERQLRQIFLFNDLVLVCSQHNLLGTYNVRSFLEVESMEIRHGTNMHIPNSFLLHSKQKAVELLDENPTGECFGWEEKIQTVIGKHRERKKSIRQEEPREFTSDTNVPESCLGKTAPVWIQDDAATMCMLCMMQFNMVRRRHHCRACGKLICKTCCKKAPLEYMKGKIDRVCTACYNVIVNKKKMSTSDSSTGETSPKKKGILHVKASEPALISGYMHCSEDGGHNWHHLWITAHKDFVLYSFKAHQDVSAISSLPLPGHEVTQIWDIESKPYVFCLSHKKKRVCMYQTDNDKHLKRWIFVLEKLVHAELPEDSSRLSSQSNSSNSSSASDSGTNNDYNPSSTGSSSQADSAQPCSNSSSLSALTVDDGSQDNADGISQYDNVDGVVTE